MTQTELADHPSPTDTVIIEPRTGWVPVELREIWRYRELLWFLAMRDVKVRYKQSMLGVGWAVLQPLLTTVVFALILERLMGGGRAMPVHGLPPEIPYIVSTYTAMSLWQLFSGSVSRGGNSLTNNQHLITKVYFPRLIMPTAPIIGSVIDFLIAFALLIGLMIVYGVTPGWQIVTAPLFMLITVAAALGLSLWLAALNAIFRDVQYIIPFGLQIGMYASPVLYTTNSILGETDPWKQMIYALNPMVGAVEGFRWAILGGEPPGMLLIPSVIVVTLLLVGGLFFFRRLERTFADVV